MIYAADKNLSPENLKQLPLTGAIRGFGQIWLSISAKSDDTLGIGRSAGTLCAYFTRHKSWLLARNSGHAALLPRLLSPRPAEARMSRPTGQMRDADGPLGAGFSSTEGGEEEQGEGGGGEDTPLLSRPRRNFLASYMFTAFLSTLFTITDCGIWGGGGGADKQEP